MAKSTRAPAIPAYWQQYIKRVARGAATGMLSPADAEQTAYLAYVKANRQYNAHKGPFEHYAKAAIRKALITSRTKEQRHSDSRCELSDDMSLGEVPPPPWAAEEDHLAVLEEKRAATHIASWIRQLPARLEAICQALYFEDVSQRVLAKRLGLTQARISQLNTDLIARAREDLAFMA